MEFSRKKIFFIILGILTLALILSAALFLNFQKKPVFVSPAIKEKPLTAKKASSVKKENLSKANLPKNVFNILFLGKGDPSHAGSNLTDSIIIIHVNTVKKQLSLISLPRDAWIADNNKTTKINAVYALALKSGQNQAEKKIKNATSNITGLPIDYLVLIDFNGFKKAIDILGGIKVKVSKTFDDYFYPIRGKELETCGKNAEQIAALSATMSGFQLEKQFPCRYEHLHFNAGWTSMDGQTALKFASSRHSNQDGGDFNRAKRQQALLEAIKNKLVSLDALNKAVPFFNQLNKTVKTDIDEKIVKAIANLVIGLDKYKVKKIVLSDANVFKTGKSPSGQFILIPKAGLNNWREIKSFIKNKITEN